MLTIKRLPLGSLNANCYLIYDEEELLIVDPGAEAEKIKRTISKLKVRPQAVLLTHAHYDHIGALDEIRESYHLPVYLSAEEKNWLADPSKNLSSLFNEAITAREADYFFHPDEKLTIGNFSFKVLANPGHSPGGVSFVFDEDEFVLSGDALFAGGVGRTDLPGSEAEKLLPAIREKIFRLPEHYTLYPGHGPESTIEKEIKTNPFFQAED